MKNEKLKAAMNRLLSAILLLLGFTSCETALEYGTPSVDFQVKGTVTDADGNPLKGIQVRVKADYGTAYDEETQRYLEEDSIYTDANGNFESHSFNAGGIAGQITFEDVDGAENGGFFRKDSVALEDTEQKQIEKGKGWYDGRYELTVRQSLEKAKADTTSVAPEK